METHEFHTHLMRHVESARAAHKTGCAMCVEVRSGNMATVLLMRDADGRFIADALNDGTASIAGTVIRETEYLNAGQMDTAPLNG